MEILRLPKDEPFITGDENIQNVDKHLIKMNDFLFIYCTKGNGQIVIDLKEYEIRENTLLLFSPGCIVSCVQNNEELEFSYLGCAADLFQEATFRFEPAFFGFLRNNPCFQFPGKGTVIVANFMHDADEIYRDRKHVFRIPIFKNILQCFFMEIYDKFFLHYDTNPLKNANRQEVLFNRFLQLVHEHYINEREVSFYADKLCITSRYLSSVVKSVGGHTPKEFIDRFVMLEIKALLQSTDMTMQEISNSLHFPDQSFFGRYFKKRTGMMPSRYRLENQ